MASMTCAGCGKPIAGEFRTYKRKRYHPECYEKLLSTQEQETKGKKAAAVAKRAETKSRHDGDAEYQVLVAYVKSKWGRLPASFAVSADRLVDEYGLTYGDIFVGLEYLYDIQERPLGDAPAVPLVPYVYEEAYELQRIIREANQHNEKLKVTQQTETVTIHKPDHTLAPVCNIDDL